MKTNIKKLLKISMLLVSSLLIATASASVYTQMFLKARVGVAGVSLQWREGTNQNATAQIAGSLCTISGLDGIAGQTVTFDDVVRIKNAGSKTVTFNITVTKCEGYTANLTSIFVEIYESTIKKATLVVWNGSIGDPLTNLLINSGSEWTLTWKVTWNNNAVTSDYVDVELRLDVKS